MHSSTKLVFVQLHKSVSTALFSCQEEGEQLPACSCKSVKGLDSNLSFKHRCLLIINLNWIIIFVAA